VAGSAARCDDPAVHDPYESVALLTCGYGVAGV
jgi:hypothetical protein